MSNSAQARIDLRLPQQTKDAIAQAAKASGFRTVTAFIVEAALEKMDKLTSRQRILQLSDLDREKVLELMSTSVIENKEYMAFRDQMKNITYEIRETN